MCPTCGQNLPIEKFNATKEQKLAEITSKSAEVERLKVEAEKNSIAIESFATMDELNAAIAERDKVISQNTDATNKLARFNQNRDDAEKTQKRIEDLKRLEKELNQQVADIERAINLAEKFIRAKVKMMDSPITNYALSITHCLKRHRTFCGRCRNSIR